MNKATDTRNESSRTDDDRHDKSRSPEQIEREVDQARAQLGRTLTELSERLSPGELLDQALGLARKHGGEFGRNLGAQVKNNPMPMIITSIGISWMMMSSGKKVTSHSADTYETNADKDGASFMDALGDSAGKTRNKAAAAGDRVQSAGANVKESAQNVRQSLVQFYSDQPLLAGSLGIAIGAALGALVPPSEIEDDVFGEASDHSVDAARSSAERKYDELRESVRPD